MAPLILAIDIGTSSTRALVFDESAQALEGALAQQPNDVQTGADGRAELDVATLLNSVEHCIDQVVATLGPKAAQIGAVAIDTLVSNMVVLDQMGVPLTPLITYADTRNAPDAEGLQHRLEEDAIHERTGCMLRTSYWPARLAWLHRTQPDVCQRAAHFATVGELIEQRFFGTSRVSTSAASWTGLLNRRTLEWDIELARDLRTNPEQLGSLGDASEPLRGLREPFRSRWPALAEVPWFPAIGDGAAANLGSGCINDQTMALTVGTTGALRIVRETLEQMPHGLWCYRIDAKRALLGGATSEGGNVFAWMRENLRLGLDGDSDQAIAAIAPDSHGLTVLPFFAGERSPGWAGDARATISGITLGTTPADLARAGLEAVAYRFGLIARSLIPTNAAPPTIIASGGAMLRSPTWMQICADVLGLPLTASDEPEATSRGVALHALESLGAIPNIAALPPRLGRTFEPNAANHAIYQAAIKRQQWLYSQIIG